MSDVEPDGADDAAPQATESPRPGFGQTLAQAREAQHMSPGEIASRLRLHPRQIIALEEERLDALPASTFVRGFVRNYAKELHLDPAPLLADLADKLPNAAPDGEPQVGTSIGAAEIRRAGMDRKSRVAVVGGSVAALLVLGLIGWLASTRVQSPAPVKAEVAGVAPAQEPAASAGAPMPAATAPGATDDAAAPPAPATQPTAEAAPSATTAAPTNTTPDVATPRPAAPTPVSAASAAGGLRLVVGDRPSWVEITQADGKVVLTGLLDAGSERRIGSAQPPLQLVIGNASSVTLEYRGKVVDLQRHVRANDLARLSLE